ncbi:MAG: LytTR family DNA-binding domain-containing protein [Bacteroidota bacterium]
MKLETQPIVRSAKRIDRSYEKECPPNNKDTLIRKSEIPIQNRKLVLNTESGVHFVCLTKIMRLESSNNYSFVHLISGNSLFIAKPLKAFEKQLCDCGFFRIHNSHLINLSFLDRLIKTNGNCAIMEDGKRLPVSRRKLQEFIMYIKSNNTFFC